MPFCTKIRKNLLIQGDFTKYKYSFSCTFFFVAPCLPHGTVLKEYSFLLL
ncbi:hypothetical protein PHG01_00807 [Streptococcus mutans PKUSS-HG01]|nr:hypothetical protein PLG01_00794 [Streptococcus mutans PKUSS-LG01]ESS19309.1 hypothetical protein PHG01_00807 [Streptococcus mutans PKUSS-HG01]